MKKILTILLTMALVLSLTVSVGAAGEAKNYAADAVWSNGTSGGVSVKDGVATATGITYQWSAPSIDVLPAVKAALGDEDSVEIIISFDVCINFNEENRDETTSARLLFRGGTTSQDEDVVSAWNEDYVESLNGDDPLFENAISNIMCYLENGFELVDGEWISYTTELSLTRAQIINDYVKTWALTFDMIQAAPTSNDKTSPIETLQFRNVAVYRADNAPATPTPEPTPEPTPTPTPTEKPTPTPAPQTPNLGGSTATDAVAGDSDTQDSDTQDENSNNIGVVIGIVAAVVVVAAGAAAAVIIIKKKKKD